MTGEEGPSDPSNGLCITAVSAVCMAQVLFADPVKALVSWCWRAPLAVLTGIIFPVLDGSFHLPFGLGGPRMPSAHNHLSLTPCPPLGTHTLVNSLPATAFLFVPFWKLLDLFYSLPRSWEPGVGSVSGLPPRPFSQMPPLPELCQLHVSLRRMHLFRLNREKAPVKQRVPTSQSLSHPRLPTNWIKIKMWCWQEIN